MSRVKNKIETLSFTSSISRIRFDCTVQSNLRNQIIKQLLNQNFLSQKNRKLSQIDSIQHLLNDVINKNSSNLIRIDNKILELLSKLKSLLFVFSCIV